LIRPKLAGSEVTGDTAAQNQAQSLLLLNPCWGWYNPLNNLDKPAQEDEESCKPNQIGALLLLGPKNGANWHAFYTSQGNQHPKPAMPTLNGKERSQVLRFPVLMIGLNVPPREIIANPGGKTNPSIARQ